MPTTHSTPSAPSWENLQLGLGAIEQLVPILDYAMQLLVDTDGNPETTLVDLTGPQAAFDATVAKYAKDHADELRPGELRCTKCGLAYSRWPRRKTCPTVRESPPQACGGALEERLFDVGEEYLRDGARPVVCKAEPILNLRAFVSAWVESRLRRGEARQQSTLRPVHEVLRCLADMMTEQVQHILESLPSDADRGDFDRRRSLLPSGANLAEAHADYLFVRGKVVALYTWLAGYARTDPMLIEMAQQPRYQPRFLPPIPLPYRPAALKKRHRYMLQAALELGAIDKKNHKSADVIVCRAEGRSANPEKFKGDFAELVRRRLLDCTRGRGGGYWLTPEGRRCIEFEKGRD